MRVRGDRGPDEPPGRHLVLTIAAASNGTRRRGFVPRRERFSGRQGGQPRTDMDLFSENERVAVEAFIRAKEYFERVASRVVTSGHELIAKEAQVAEARANMSIRRDELARVRSSE